MRGVFEVPLKLHEGGADVMMVRLVQMHTQSQLLLQLQVVVAVVVIVWPCETQAVLC